MKEFTRTQWTDYNARDVWEPRFRQISRMSRKVEVETVLNRLRDVAMPALVLYEFNGLKLPRPLVAKILGVHSAPQVFHNQVVPWKEGEPFNLRTVIGKEDDVNSFMKAYCNREDTLVGTLLGYPKCCSEAFTQRWKIQNQRDFTWDMMGVKNNLNTAVIDPFYRLNPMYSKLGLRYIYHMPCSVRCVKSNSMANAYRKLWGKEESRWLDEIFRWPVEWSSLHGAAEIRTPVCKIITDTDPTDVEQVIQFPRRGYPDEGAVGNRFPYTGEEELHSNNGFSSEAAMSEAHAVVLAASNEAKRVISITDPGSGNGLLLHKLGLMHVGVRDLLGIDSNHHAIEQGRRRFTDIDFIKCNIFDAPDKVHPVDGYRNADLIVFMPGRLLECPDEAQEFVDSLRFRYLLLYGYTAYAHKVCDLKKQYWPECKVLSEVVGDTAFATLLEKP
ncbi:MAG: DUF483 domain-containing protein [Candidatus Thorarchaeota archaeon]|jgi:hypothetical protein